MSWSKQSNLFCSKNTLDDVEMKLRERARAAIEAVLNNEYTYRFVSVNDFTKWINNKMIDRCQQAIEICHQRTDVTNIHSLTQGLDLLLDLEN